MKKLISILCVIISLSMLIAAPMSVQAKSTDISLDEPVTLSFDENHTKYELHFEVPSTDFYTVYTENAVPNATLIYVGENYPDESEEYFFFEAPDNNLKVNASEYFARTAHLYDGSYGSDKNVKISVSVDFSKTEVKSAQMTIKIKKHIHSELIPYRFAASFDEYGGYGNDMCPDCGCYNKWDYKIINQVYLKTDKTKFVYDGKKKTPTFSLYYYDVPAPWQDTGSDYYKKVALDKKYYTVSRKSGDNAKSVGKHKYTVTLQGDYQGSKTIEYKIVPKGTSVSRITAGRKKLSVKWKKQTTQTTGYQIQYSTDKNFKKGAKTVTVTKNKTVSKTIKSLKSGKKYYVRVRTYKTVGKTKYYSSWSKAKSVKTK